jgi:protein disulfide-isomerase A1
MDAIPRSAEIIVVCFRTRCCLVKPVLIHFTGQRIVSQVLKRVLDPIVELDEQRFNIMKALDVPLLVLNRAPDDEFSLKTMSSLAQQELSGRFFVGVVTDSSFTGTVPTTIPFLTVHNVLDEVTPTYQGPFELSSVLDFANTVSSPLISRFDSSTLANFVKVKPAKSHCIH